MFLSDKDVQLMRKHANQLSSSDIYYLKMEKRRLLSGIPHVIDCECYSVGKKKYLREISIYDMRNNRVDTYYICHLNNEIPMENSTVRYQIRNIHGMDIVRERKWGYFTEEEFLSIMIDSYKHDDVFFAYKGGTIEIYWIRYVCCHVIFKYLDVKSMKSY